MKAPTSRVPGVTLGLTLAALPLACSFLALPAAGADEGPEAIAMEAAENQEALDEFGKRVLAAIASGDRGTFAQSVLVAPGDMEEIFSKFPEEMRERMPENRRPGSEEFDQMMAAQLEKAAETFDGLTAFAKKNAIELGGALELAAVEPDTLRMQGNFPMSDLVTVRFRTAGQGADAEPFAVALRECGLIGRGWICHGGIGWQDLPDGILDEGAERELMVEQARSQGKPLPPGLPAPAIEFVRVADGGHPASMDIPAVVSALLEEWGRRQAKRPPYNRLPKA